VGNRATTYGPREITVKSQNSKQHTSVAAVQPQTTFPKEDRMNTQNFTTLSFLKKSLLAAVIMACAIMPATISAQRCTGLTTSNQVQNGGFQAGSTGYTIPNWTVAWDSTADPDFAVEGNGHNSSQAMWLGSVPGTNRISQALPNLNGGKIYTVCFYLANASDSSSSPSSFEAIWNDSDVLHMVGNAGFDYQYYSFQVVALGSGKDVLSFQARQVPSFYYLDDVSVQRCTTCSAPSLPEGQRKVLPSNSQ
jgi:hypothetical protein